MLFALFLLEVPPPPAGQTVVGCSPPNFFFEIFLEITPISLILLFQNCLRENFFIFLFPTRYKTSCFDELFFSKLTRTQYYLVILKITLRNIICLEYVYSRYS